jgi:hypothetical protein
MFGLINKEVFLDQMSNYKILKKGSDPCNQCVLEPYFLIRQN